MPSKTTIRRLCGETAALYFEVPNANYDSNMKIPLSKGALRCRQHHNAF